MLLTVIQCGYVFQFFPAGGYEPFAVPNFNFFQGLQAVHGKARADDLNLFDSGFHQFLQGKVGVRL